MATKANQWKSKNKVGQQELELPSGNTCLVRSIKPEAFLESGIIPDALSGMVMKAINSKKGMPPSAMKEIADDPKKLAAALEIFDRALVFCVLDPQVEMAPTCGKEECQHPYTGGDGVHVDRTVSGYHKFVEPARDPEVLYTDAVDLEDKQFIFQWAVGGVEDVAKFRAQLDNAMESTQPSGQVQKQAL